MAKCYFFILIFSLLSRSSKFGGSCAHEIKQHHSPVLTREVKTSSTSLVWLIGTQKWPPLSLLEPLNGISWNFTGRKMSISSDNADNASWSWDKPGQSPRASWSAVVYTSFIPKSNYYIAYHVTDSSCLIDSSVHKSSEETRSLCYHTFLKA